MALPRVLLLNPPFAPRFSRTGARWQTRTKTDTLCWPSWLGYATGWLEKNGCEVVLIDAPARNTGVHEIERFSESWSPDMVVLDTSTASLFNDISIAERLKVKLDVPVVLVGPHASALPEETLMLSDKVDVVCKGEYDQTLVDLTKTFEGGADLSRVPGIAYRSNGRIKRTQDRPLIKDLDSFPFVSSVYKRFLNPYDYFYGMCLYPMIQIFTSRGCPSRCVYCVWPQTMMGHEFRVRSVSNVVDELEYIADELPMIKEIILEDDTFTYDKKRVSEFCDEIFHRDLHRTVFNEGGRYWTANARADIPLDLLRRMKRAGCRMLIVGFESGSQEILNKAKKGIKVETARHFAKNAKKAGVQVMGCFMVGLPGENRKTALETLKFANEIAPDFLFFNLASPLPGTEFYDYCKKNGFLKSTDFRDWVDEEGYLKPMLNYPDFSPEEMKKIVDTMALRYVLQPQYVFRVLRHIAKDYREIYHYSRAIRHMMHYLRATKSHQKRMDPPGD